MVIDGAWLGDARSLPYGLLLYLRYQCRPGVDRNHYSFRLAFRSPPPEEAHIPSLDQFVQPEVPGCLHGLPCLEGLWEKRVLDHQSVALGEAYVRRENGPPNDANYVSRHNLAPHYVSFFSRADNLKFLFQDRDELLFDADPLHVLVEVVTPPQRRQRSKNRSGEEQKFKPLVHPIPYKAQYGGRPQVHGEIACEVSEQDDVVRDTLTAIVWDLISVLSIRLPVLERLFDCQPCLGVGLKHVTNLQDVHRVLLLMPLLPLWLVRPDVGLG
mmetsp:Transcript_30825/g.57582  ORF Transcript_30825/g.57582 Transcript_30825/m.57582 type:complete len:270 (-) Transcript_30825:156-965(-)